MEISALLQKYNVAAPRYTSYPTVPYWENNAFNQQKWLEKLLKSYAKTKKEGISVYIHLPFCESLCTYCGCNTRITKNHSVEKPYIDALIKEWNMYGAIFGERPKIKEIHLGGGTPTFFSPQNLERLIFSVQGTTLTDAEYSFEGHPDSTSAAHLKTLYQLGFKRLSLGIQDFDPKVQAMINRYQTPEQVFKVVSEAREMGYESINFDLIYGLPGQTVGGLTRAFATAIDMRPDRVAFYSYAHVPWLRPGQRHFTEKDIPVGENKFRLYQLGRKFLLEKGYQEIGMDHFALKSDRLYQAGKSRRLHRNFMGYTHQHTHILIGLGVSAISDCYEAFAQNAKTVEGYLRQIGNNSFPIEKGHILNGQDLRIRQHILNLMCKNATRFNEKIPAAILERLKSLIEDELVEIKDKEVFVSAKGKSFLRNVCMAFDEHLWNKQPQTKLFSSTI